MARRRALGGLLRRPDRALTILQLTRIATEGPSQGAVVLSKHEDDSLCGRRSSDERPDR